MDLHIREVSTENWQTIACLSVKKNQQDYIESNALSIVQSVFESEWQSVGLYDGEIAIGYAMYGKVKREGNVWLDRFMIDAKYQGLGYASKILPILLKHIEELYDTEMIYLSVTRDNTKAQALYERLGFRFNGEEDHSGIVSGLVMVRDTSTI